MDASQVIASMNQRWTELLNDYYDHVAEEYMKHISNEYDIDLNELLEKASKLKHDIMKKATEVINDNRQTELKKKQPSKAAIKAAEKAAKKETEEKNTYSDYTRSQLIDKCREYKLPVKRKNQDMIDALLEYDKNKEQD